MDLAIRSYGAASLGDRHEFAQLVLPLAGEVALDIEGRTGRLDPLRGAVVAPEAWHDQAGTHGNRSLIVDIGRDVVAQDGVIRATIEGLADAPFMVLGPAARKLVEYMGILRERQPVPAAMLRGWIPLLLDTLAFDAPRPRSRLTALLAQVAANPGLPWSTETMAQAAHLSVSRLHALFREELDASPHAWLLEQRIARACEQLEGSAMPIAEVALTTGFADQSALNRAMRLYRDTTPGAYRRQRQENPAGQGKENLPCM